MKRVNAKNSQGTPPTPGHLGLGMLTKKIALNNSTQREAIEKIRSHTFVMGSGSGFW